MIKAPFNFVPLAEQVYIPSWGKLISQDVPFSDGISGTIDLEIETISPLFIRNGHTKEDKKDNTREYRSSCKTEDGRFFIPGSSIKGEVRSILEILSFSRMEVDKNSQFAEREWNNTKLYTLKGKQSELHCGYIKRSKSGNDFVVIDCGKPYRIGHKRIDEYLKIWGKDKLFEKFFCKASDYKLTDLYKVGDINYDLRSSIFKYYLTTGCPLRKLRFSLDNTSTEYSDRLFFNPEGDIEGEIVFTGQPTQWVWPRPNENSSKVEKDHAGKYYEFVFASENEGEYFLSQDDFSHFKFIYSETQEWNRVKNFVDDKDSRGIPVFFRIAKGKLKDFGLAYLYKLPYDKTPYQILTNKYKKILERQKEDIDAFDLAQCIFGYVDNRTQAEMKRKQIESFKGRVQFGPAFSDNAEEDHSETLILNSPKASYYPIYIKQDGNAQGNISGEYRTYNDGQLSGWKRYVVRRGADVYPKKMDNPKLDTVIHPVKPGSVFDGCIHFHNLRPIELGALLSALTFHSTDKCFHQLGQGKPYGYGKVKYKVKLHCDTGTTPEYYMALFEEEMNRKIGNWIDSDAICALVTMAQIEVTELDYQYMRLEMDGVNDFETAKQEKEYLQDFRSLERNVLKPQSLQFYIYSYKQELKKKEEARLSELKMQELVRLQEWCNSIMTKVVNKDEAELQMINDSIEELKKTSNYVSLDDKQGLLTMLDDKKKEIEEAIRGRMIIDTVAAGLSADIAKVTSLGNLQGRVKTWLKKVNKVEGRTILTQEEIETVRVALKNLSSKELKKASKRESSVWKEFASLMGEENVNIIFEELYKRS